MRAILKASTNSFSPTEIRDRLKEGGYDFSKHKHANPLASIHGVLKRIHESGDAETKEAKDGSGTRYRWKGARDASPVPAPRHLDLASSLSTIADSTAIAKVLDSTESMRRLAETMTVSQANLEQALGLGKYKELVDQISYSTKALQNLGLVIGPSKKK